MCTNYCLGKFLLGSFLLASNNIGRLELRKHVKKLGFLADLSVKGWGASAKNAFFLPQNKKNALQCSETKEYAKTFCEIMSRVFVNNFFQYFLRI